jgi:hypothetical protein
MIEIKRAKPFSCELHDPKGNLVGMLYNYDEILMIQVQIAKEDVEGYCIYWKDYEIPINKKGELTIYPQGFIDSQQRLFSELIKIRKEKYEKE